MSELKQCPCGKTPTTLGINETQGGKWMDITPDCCGEWTVEGRTSYKVGGKRYAIAVQIWNESPRFWEPDRSER
jgi:hypothetical protein